jgi:hypothetical protein
LAPLPVLSQAHPTTQVASDHYTANGTTTPTGGWLPHSHNLGWRRDHTVLNPSLQDTDAKPPTLMASNITLRFEEQFSVSTHRDRRRTTSSVRYSPFAPLSVLSSPSPFTQNTLPPQAIISAGRWCGNLAQGDNRQRSQLQGSQLQEATTRQPNKGSKYSSRDAAGLRQQARRLQRAKSFVQCSYWDNSDRWKSLFHKWTNNDVAVGIRITTIDTSPHSCKTMPFIWNYT